MLKSLIAVAVLGSPALAQPAPPQPLAMKLVVRAGADTRVHELAIFDQGCGKVEDKAVAYEDEISVCARPAASGVQVEVSWRTRNGNTEYRTTSNGIVQRGGKLEVGRTGVRFVLQLT